MDNPEYILPIVLLLLAFLYKLFIHRSVTPAMFVLLLLEFPVDIAFLINSFIVAYIIRTRSAAHLAYFIGFLTMTILVVFSWRQSTKWFESDRFYKCGAMTSITYLICIAGLVWSVSLLVSIGVNK